MIRIIFFSNSKNSLNSFLGLRNPCTFFALIKLEPGDETKSGDILIGAFFTRYIGDEGVMPIRENNISNSYLSEKTFLTVFIDILASRYSVCQSNSLANFKL